MSFIYFCLVHFSFIVFSSIDSHYSSLHSVCLLLWASVRSKKVTLFMIWTDIHIIRLSVCYFIILSTAMYVYHYECFIITSKCSNFVSSPVPLSGLAFPRIPGSPVCFFGCPSFLRMIWPPQVTFLMVIKVSSTFVCWSTMLVSCFSMLHPASFSSLLFLHFLVFSTNFLLDPKF